MKSKVIEKPNGEMGGGGDERWGAAFYGSIPRDELPQKEVRWRQRKNQTEV